MSNIFITLATVAKAIKTFYRPYFLMLLVKLECLSVARLSILV